MRNTGPFCQLHGESIWVSAKACDSRGNRTGGSQSRDAYRSGADRCGVVDQAAARGGNPRLIRIGAASAAGVPKPATPSIKPAKI